MVRCVSAEKSLSKGFLGKNNGVWSRDEFWRSDVVLTVQMCIFSTLGHAASESHYPLWLRQYLQNQIFVFIFSKTFSVAANMPKKKVVFFLISWPHKRSE